MCRIKVLTIVAVAVFASAIGQVRAAEMTDVPVPNSGFELIYKPDSTTITATITGWTQGVGPDCPIDNGVYTFSDASSGTLADIPGWLGYDRAGWIVGGGTYGRDQTTGNLQGSVSTGNNHTPGGAYCYLANGGGWSNAAGGLIVSAASVGNILNNCTYILSMHANGSATPVVLKLLANGTELAPSSSVWPTLSGGYQEFSRTYDATSLSSHVGKALTIVLGVGRNASGTQSHFDDVSLRYYVPSPPGQASDPKPMNGVTSVWTGADVILSWTAGFDAESSNVYFGTDPTPDSGEFQGNQVETTFNAGILNAETTYYWRIDQVNTLGTTTGEVWSFTTMEPPVAGRNTFLVPIPATVASWKEFAYLAAVPASAAVNTGGPSVIALDESGTILEEITHYLTLYNPENIYTIDTSGSLNEVACDLAQTFWTTTSYVVLVGDGDYENALCASALAARLEVPLMFFNASTGLSSATLDVIDNDLQCATALTVNGNSTVTTQLSGISVSQTSLANANAILGWIVSNIGAVDYFAYTNPDDRAGSWKAPKLSLAAPLLAAAHEGAVVPIAYDVDWMGTYFNYSTETTTRPSGAPSGDKWRLGTMTPVTTTYDFCITVIGDYYQYVNIDFNDDGDYGDAGEGPFLEAGNEIDFDGTMFQVITGVPGEFHGPGDVTLIYPTASDMVEDLSTYFTTNGGHPEYLCIVGVFDTMPYGTEVYWGGGIIGVGDALISNVDDDVFVELATGRIVALDVTFGTLQATRSSTYNDLVNDDWEKKVVLMGGGSLNSLRYASRYLQNVGFDAPDELDRHFDEGEQVYMQNRSVISHSWHSCQFGWGWGPGYGCGEPNLDEYLIEPSIAESGGCLTEAIHSPDTLWEYMVSLQIMRRGAICHIGCTATASFCYETPRVAFWIGIAAGDTLGQAWKKGAITTEYCAQANISPGWDDEAPVVLFGDPAVKINIPSSPTQTPAHVDVDGTTLTAVAPTFTLGTYDDPGNPDNIYTYYGPGTYPEYWTPAANYLASYTTDGTITNLTETTSCPGGLGWPGSDAWFIDEHQDGTESVYWRVRFLEWAGTYNSTITNQLSSIKYNVSVTMWRCISGNVGLEGVVMNGLPGNPVTTADGSYSVEVQEGWSGTVTPTLAGYTFSPASRIYTNVTSDQLNQDYTAHSVRGDTNLDGRIDLVDFACLAANWLDTDCDAGNNFCSGADIDQADGVGLDDLLILADNWLEGASHLIARWRLDELNGTVASDSMGGNNGTLKGNPTWRPSDGKIGGALEFDGVGDYVEVAGYKGISGTNPRTVTAWVKTESGLSIVRWGALESSGGLWSNVITADGKLRVAVWGGSVVGDTTINDNTWHHVAIVLPDKGGVKVEDIRLYVDGGREDTTVSNGAQTIDTAVGIDLLISLDGSDGLLDDVRIYDYAVPEYLIAEMANLSLIAHWQFDELSGMVASDSVGGNDGTLNGDPTWRPSDGKIGGALEFDGVGDYVEVEGYRGISGSNARTVTAWVRIEPGASSLSIVRWGTLGISGGLWSNVINTDGKLRAAVVGGSVVGDTVIDDNTWHHVAIVLPDKEDVKVEDIRLYVDGEQEGTIVSFGSQTIDTGVDMDVLISLDGSVGLLDDVRIYNYALNEGEIGSLAGVL